jgi:LmbE family N-acetylglucosaminyl deacetylase
MNVLAVGAHFDDIELGCGGTVAKHTANGDRVWIFVATNSGYSNYARRVLRKKDVAFEEGKNAAGILGATLICGDHDTNYVEYNDDLMLQLVKIVEENQIDIIYTHWVHDVHRDHFIVGRASLSAGRRVPRVLMYRSNYYDTYEAFTGNFYIDISETFDVKVQAVRAHQSELNRVGEKWIRFFRNQNQNDGQKIGVEYAEAFEAARYVM